MGEAQRLRERFRGCLLGVAVGDAIGAPFEGRARVPDAELHSWADAAEPLRWTDDTHMTIGLARSLLACGGFDGPHAAAQFTRDYESEPWRGYGAGPPRVFAALAAGAAWDEPARRLFGGTGSFGNGAAMRVAPVGLAFHDDIEALVRTARSSARITHAHELGQEAAVLQAAAVGWLVTATPQVPRDLTPHLLAHVRDIVADPAWRRPLDEVARGVKAGWGVEEATEVLGNGITGVEAVPAALHAFLRHPLSLAGAVTYAVRLGGDTDTIASMTGALAGAYLGEGAVPAGWRSRLEAAEEIVALADELVARAA